MMLYKTIESYYTQLRVKGKYAKGLKEDLVLVSLIDDFFKDERHSFICQLDAQIINKLIRCILEKNCLHNPEIKIPKFPLYKYTYPG